MEENSIVEELVPEVLPELEPEVEPIPVKSKILIRNARVADIPQLEDLLIEFYEIQRRKGNKTLAKDPTVLRGGVILELGMNFTNPNCKIVVADKDNIIIGFFIAELTFCRPIEEYHRSVWIRGDYISGKSLANPRILEKMWLEIYKWGINNGASYFFGDIHQANQSSIRTAKSAGFTGKITKFIKLAESNGG